MGTFISNNYRREVFTNFLRDFLPDDFEPREEETYFDFKNIERGYRLGKCKSLDLDIFEFRTKSGHDPRVTLTREVVSCMKKYGYSPNALAVFHSERSHNWRLSLITTDYSIEDGKVKTEHSNPRRFSFLLGKGCKEHTPKTRLLNRGTVSSLDDLKERFDIEVVSKEFYNSLFGWYKWACENVTFPAGDTSTDSKGKHNVRQTKDSNELNLIRLITRLMFVWFIKQKDLIPSWVFDQNELEKILADFDPESEKDGNYYNAVLQNLFFATLNKKIEERAFADDKKVSYNKQFGVKNFYRDNAKKSFFKESNQKIIERFRPVPFLNGGLFECLDKLDDDKDGMKNIQEFTDGFSREPEWMAFVPNMLFWQEDDGKHEGLIHLLNRYNFTVDENSPSDVQVALDPELLGKVFENLLGTYNPETSETARKSSGSFYTPRQIVNFMIDEAMKAHLASTVKSISESELRQLFDDGTDDFDAANKEEIVSALKKLKILDPACGSGAFPMGTLQRLVHLIGKCGGVSSDRTALYALKLELIEKCLYGVDIQPIAVQICKLRFFISLICEQERTDSVQDNYGVNPLPNLETKFVAANSLIGLESNAETELFSDPDGKIAEKKAEIQGKRHEHFNAPTAELKAKCRAEDKKLREELVVLLEKNKTFAPKDANQLAGWNPYDQNAVSEFFDAEWMFNVSDGFDIVIGNPPYISTKGVTNEDKKKYEAEFGFSDDTYNLFTFKGLSLLKDGGSLSYIIPKTFWTTQTKRNMRDLILQNQINYIFDTANPFDAVMVDACIMQVLKRPMPKEHKVKFLDGTKDLKAPIHYEPISQAVYINTQNSVIFKPTKLNLRIYELYGAKVKELYDKWWNKIETSKKISQNKAELETYRASLKPGDITLLGCLTDGGVGLQTGNNGKYIAVRRSTKWAANIIESRPKKLAEALTKNGKIKIKGLDNIANTKAFLEKKSENEIADLFDSLKEKYGRDIFGQGYIYKIIDDSEIANVDELTDDEKENGIDTSKKYYVPYDKGDKDGNRWYLETPFAIAWSKENVRFLKTDPKARYQGYTFYFREGFCWSDINTKFLKCRKKSKSVNDVKSMSLYGLTNKVPEFYIVSLINSDFISDYVDNFVNNTQTFQINDARQLPIIIPAAKDLTSIKKNFDKVVSLKKTVAGLATTVSEIEQELKQLEEYLNHFVEKLYFV